MCNVPSPPESDSSEKRPFKGCMLDSGFRQLVGPKSKRLAPQYVFLLPQTPTSMCGHWGHLQFHRASKIQSHKASAQILANGTTSRACRWKSPILSPLPEGYPDGVRAVPREAHLLLGFFFSSGCSYWQWLLFNFLQNIRWHLFVCFWPWGVST